MPIHASPGVYFETIDFSLYAPRLSKSILALVGKTRKGPTEPTFVSSVRQFIDLFGVPRKGDFSSLAAISFLEFGNSLWFSRIVGSSAKKASIEIPKAIEVDEEAITTVTNENEYIFKSTLNNSPVPGTLEIYVKDPENTNNFITITDDGNGNFSPTENSDISIYPNFIDYDTGLYRFTLDSVTDEDEVVMKYNYVEHSVVGESTLIVDEVDDVSYSYSGLLAHPNIVNAPESFELTIESGEDVYTFVTSGEPTSNEYTLSGTNLAEESIGTGLLNIITGEWEVTFSGISINIDDVFVADYNYSTYKLKTLGVVGEENPSGGIFGSAYIGSLNTVIIPNSVSILVNDSEVATDNGEGKLITGVETCDNSVDYNTKAIEFALVTPPSENFEIVASYLSKYTQILETIGVEGSEGGSVSGTLTETAIVKNSVTVKIGTGVILNDDGEGNLLGSDGNGTINYETGEISVNYSATLAEGDSITVHYLSKMGTIESLYKGESYNNIKVEFYKDVFNGFGMKVWNSNQATTELPEEHFKNITFDDSTKSTFITNKVTSRQIEIILTDESAGVIPLYNNSLTLSGGTDDKNNIDANSAVTALSQFSNNEQYDINLIACPDFPGNKIIINKLIQLCEIERGDCFAIIDPPQNLTTQQVVEWHNGSGQWANENSLNSSFAALYYPWVQISDEFTEALQWVPPSVRMVSVFAYNDRVAEVWNAPAGLNRGRLFRVQKVERQLNVTDRDLLYATGTNAVNPICDFVGDGIVVYGQKTLQRKPSALDRVNVMRLIIYITKILATATKYLLFEPNDRLTWTLYSQLVNPLLTDIRQRRGLYEFKVVCDETTNTPYDIDNNTMVAEIWLKPTKVAERLINRFVITSTGANFSELET